MKEFNCNRNIAYENEFLQIEMINPNYPYMLMKRRGVVALPLFKDGTICFIKANRRSYEGDKKVYFELPRGFKDENETDEQSCARELKEETGLVPKSFVQLGFVEPDTGICKNRVSIYRVDVESRTETVWKWSDDSDKEDRMVYRFTLPEIKEKIRYGLIIDAFTLSALGYHLLSII